MQLEYYCHPIIDLSCKDVGLLADCENIVQETLSKLGGLDIIVSNAVGQRLVTRPEIVGFVSVRSYDHF